MKFHTFFSSSLFFSVYVLLQSSFAFGSVQVAKTITVDKSGNGNFNSIQEAINSVPDGNSQWIRIYIHSPRSLPMGRNFSCTETSKRAIPRRLRKIRKSQLLTDNHGWTTVTAIPPSTISRRTSSQIGKPLHTPFLPRRPQRRRNVLPLLPPPFSPLSTLPTLDGTARNNSSSNFIYPVAAPLHSRQSQKTSLPRSFKEALLHCRLHGHSSKACPNHPSRTKIHADPLVPFGNIGEESFPTDRPDVLDAFMPQTLGFYKNLKILQKAAVIDARLRPGLLSVQDITATLLAACEPDQVFKLTIMSDKRFWLQLPEDCDRMHFIAKVKPILEGLPYTIYPWSPRIDTEPVQFLYKVWLDLCKVPIHAWNAEHLLPLCSQVGLLLDHTPFHQLHDMSALRVVLAVPKLKAVPRSLNFTIRGLKLSIPIKIVGWVAEVTTIRPAPDPTPPPSYFRQIEARYQERRGNKSTLPTEGLNATDFQLLFDTWYKMQDGHCKSDLKAMLMKSPLWKRKQKELSSAPSSSKSHVGATDHNRFRLLQGASSEQHGDKVMVHTGGATNDQQLVLVGPSASDPELPQADLVLSPIKRLPTVIGDKLAPKFKNPLSLGTDSTTTECAIQFVK